MPRLPDVYGQRQTAQPGRAFAGFNPDTSGPAALGQGLFNLGAGIKAASDREDDEIADLEMETARSQLLRGAIDAEREVQNEQDFGKWDALYAARMSQIAQSASAGITDERRRARFDLMAGDALARGRDRVLTAVKGRETDFARARLGDVLDGNVDTALGVSDPGQRQALLDNAGRSIDAALARGYLTEQEAATMKRRLVENYAERRIGMLSPEERLRAVGRSRPGRLSAELTAAIDAAASRPENAAILRRFALLESGGDTGAVNPNSGAAGAFQFIPSTAAEYGLADPMDAGASAKAADALLERNRAALRSSLGREPTGAELYLAHVQGAGGAAALLRNPDANAIVALSAAYGNNPDRARPAIELNGGNGRMTAGAYAAMIARKFNAASVVDAPGPNPDEGLARYLPPDQAAKIAEQAEREIDAESRRALAEYVSNFEAFTAAVQSGADVDPAVAAMYSDEALNAMVPDPEQRRLLRETRNDALLSADISSRLKGASPEDIAGMAREIGARAEGTVYNAAGLALAPSRAQLAASFQAAVARDWKARTEDPAGYALSASPFLQALADRTDRPGGAEAYAEAILTDQARLGIPARDRRVLTDAQAKELAAQINETPAAQVGATYADLQQRYGKHAGLVRSHLESAGVSPAKHIAGLYADQPATSQAIAAVADLDRDELIAGLDPTVPSDVRTRLAGEMDEFREAFLAGDFSGAAQRQYAALFAIAEKMAFADVRRTGDASDAVARAAKALIDDVYEVFSTSRINAYVPRMIDGRPVDPAEVEDRAEAMLDNRALVAFGPVPFGEATGEPQSIRMARTIRGAMNGTWITNDTGDGLVLVVDMGDGTSLPVVNDKGDRYELKFLP